MSHYDVAVIGAGAAGLAAGLTLQKAGRSFIVLEARDRIGGRAFTDTATLGLPFDMGAHWLHSARQNPFTAIADTLGIAYKSDIDFGPDHATRLGRGGLLPAAAQAEASDYIETVLNAAIGAGAAGRDVAFSDVMDPKNRWNSLTRQLIGQITSSDPELCSTLDGSRYDYDGGDFPVRDGYGALVARHAAGLPVTLSTPVTRIDWSGREVRVETGRGTVTASAIVIAVPVNVLIAGGIRFDPALPATLVEAFHDCPMGVSEKLAILLDRPVDGFGHVYGDVIFEDASKAPFNLHLNPFGRPLLVSHFGGSHGAALEKLGDAAMMDLAMEALVEAFGAGMRTRVVKTLRTHWASDPYTLGGYSHAKPGRAVSRLRFSEPVGDRIVLAGEHCSIPFFSTVHGAHLSGIAAAEKALSLAAA
ncbi:amine oxidase [Aestuariivirga litoralis]|uniref:Tryptophan 2-monooxygenase n=1 Tax=Aestuariivirga litoralis TaxID=2650924 RepID=A0A2W2BT35_9HYPH|nr:NAD(P)/FAD-dependent oxidoreductase [Aestuariivirga litoralis]PZF78847.1 amine oxidase [Aestuariivirga litoralis]